MVKWSNGSFLNLSSMTDLAAAPEPAEVCAISLQPLFRNPCGTKYAHAIKMDSSVSQLVETAGVKL